MRVIRCSIPICIAFTNPSQQYASDYAAVLLSRVREVYTGICFRASKIINVVDIAVDSNGTRIYTMPEYDNMRRDNTTTSNVMVVVDKLVPMQYDIIPKCKVVNIDSKTIICSWEHGIVNLVYHANLQHVAKNQIIPVRVGNARCTYTKSHITINAVQFIPIKPNQSTYITDKPTADDVTYANTLYTQAVEYISSINTQSPRYIEFARMLSFTDESQSDNGQNVDIRDLIKSGSEFIATRSYVSNPSHLSARVFKKSLKLNIECKWIVSIASMIDDCISFVDDCNSLAITYESHDDFASNKFIWDTYNNIKSKMATKKSRVASK